MRLALMVFGIFLAFIGASDVFYNNQKMFSPLVRWLIMIGGVLMLASSL